MKIFNYEKYKEIKLDSEAISLITKIYEKKGEQGNYLEKEPEILSTLVEVARVQSTEASNKIEGIVTTAERITALLKRKSKPLNRDEEEIAGYRDVLNTIHNNYEHIPFTSSYILQLHRDLLKFTSLAFAGRYKNVDNVIVEKNADGEIVNTLFEPLKPYETADAIADICEQYAKALANEYIDPLILIPIVIRDFLCVHPFNDGNGRMSRLLALLLLYKSGFVVGKYISIERIIWETKQDYYKSLRQSDDGWHESKNNPLPFIKYILQILYMAYREFDERVVSVVKDGASKQDQVKRVIDSRIGKISKKEIAEQLPFVSEATIKLALNALVKDGYIKVVGTGKNSAYVRTNKGEAK
ncbi:MAG: Fic family protein [Erysipelotrichales bacterium]|nr:Fic family protein [Erysipelotrichales bacterium]